MKLLENTRIRKCITILLSIQLTLSMAMVSFASGANYAENAAKWGFEQAFWVVLFVTLVVAAGALEKSLSVNPREDETCFINSNSYRGYWRHISLSL